MMNLITPLGFRGFPKTELQEQYEALLLEANNEPFFYGNPLDPNAPRMVVVIDEFVVGFFEIGTMEYEGRSYYRTNRPYTKKDCRGKGYMLDALKSWYNRRRPALSWIDDDNLSSIRLFQNLGFVSKQALFHKNKHGHLYILV